MGSRKKAVKLPPLVRGHFMWNENSRELEFIQITPGKVVHPFLDPGRQNSSGPNRSYGSKSSNVAAQIGKVRMAQNTKAKDSTSISLHDVKIVAINMLIVDRLKKGFNFLSKRFETLSLSPQFDHLLIYLLHYFKYFFSQLKKRKEMQDSSYLEPSKAEIKDCEQSHVKLNEARSQVAQQYCALLLGVETSSAHHMECGQRRSSNSHSDMILYEEIYEFLTFFVWVTFGRRSYKLIFIEISNMLRSQTFNPANQRVYQKAFDHAEMMKGRIDSSDEDDDKDQSDDSGKSFRLPKRPPIASIVNQRSNVLTTLLPSTKERSSHLYGKKSDSTTSFSDSPKNNTKTTFSLNNPPSEESVQKIGIIGEDFKNYNREDLTYVDSDSEKEAEMAKEMDTAVFVEPPSKLLLPRSRCVSKHKVFSRATTAEHRGKSASSKNSRNVFN